MAGSTRSGGRYQVDAARLPPLGPDPYGPPYGLDAERMAAVSLLTAIGLGTVAFRLPEGPQRTSVEAPANATIAQLIDGFCR